MTYSVPDFRRPLVPPPDRNPLPFVPRPSPGGGFEGFDVLGTAHFTRKSVTDAVMAASSGKYSSLALELDRQRFEALNVAPYRLPWGAKGEVEGEFVAASDALGNREGDVWLIDVSLGGIRSRVAENMTISELREWNYVSSRLRDYEIAGIRLWESGREHEAMRYLDMTTKAMERFAPSLYRTLIEERNLIMAARLLEVASTTKGKGLVLVGKAHAEGILELLSDTRSISEGFERFGIEYTPPLRIRRVAVN